MKTRATVPTLQALKERKAAGDPFLTEDEYAAMFDAAVRKYLGISAEEFVRRWDAGEYVDIADTPGNLHIMDLAMMIPARECQNT